MQGNFNQFYLIYVSMCNQREKNAGPPLHHTQTTIVHVPKNTKVTCLNDYKPVALTSVAMMCFERLVMPLIKTKQNGLNLAVSKHRKFNFFQCVNHSRVIRDPRAKPKGLLGGALEHS